MDQINLKHTLDMNMGIELQIFFILSIIQIAVVTTVLIIKTIHSLKNNDFNNYID